jgi:hypothetical protein
MIRVSNSDLSIVSRTDKGGKIKSVSSYMTGNDESPKWLIDDTTIPGSLSEKWCAGGTKEHWVILELKQAYELYRFQIYDCGNKENASDNLTYYRIYTSMSGKDDDWTLVLDEKNVPANEDHNLKENYIKPTVGRFVKFVPYNPDMAITIRIWQFDVWGLDAKKPVGIEDVSVSGVKIAPNPVKAGDRIRVVTGEAGKIRLVSLQGVLMSEQTITDPVTYVSTAGLTTGTYMLQVIGSTTTGFKVIVK